MSPKHSISFCPVCGGGLCGIRICGAASKSDVGAVDQPSDRPEPCCPPRGLIVCDECEAIWLEPDVTTAHQYPDAEDARCPLCRASLWGGSSRWATAEDIAQLGWEFAVDPDLDATTEEDIA